MFFAGEKTRSVYEALDIDHYIQDRAVEFVQARRHITVAVSELNRVTVIRQYDNGNFRITSTFFRPGGDIRERITRTTVPLGAQTVDVSEERFHATSLKPSSTITTAQHSGVEGVRKRVRDLFIAVNELLEKGAGMPTSLERQVEACLRANKRHKLKTLSRT